MSIRYKLLVLSGVLGLIIAVKSSVSLFGAWDKKNTFLFAKQSSESINLLLTAAGNWAVERGVTNSGLSSASKASGKMLDIIAQRRKNGDEAYQAAMAKIQEYDFSGKDELLEKVTAAYEAAVEMRKQADKNLPMPQIRRNSKLLKSWVPTMSKLIISSQNLRFALTKATAAVEPELGRQAQLKHFSWLMSEFAGRERAVIGGTISANLGIDEAKLQTLSEFRGHVKVGWDMVQKLSGESNEEVVQSVEQTRSLFFGPFQELRESIYEAAINGDDYPVGTQAWIDQSTAAINTILATQSTSTKETEAYLEELLDEANTVLLFEATLLLVSLGIVGVAFYVVLMRVTRPIDEMTESMNILAGGDTEVDIPCVGQNDELGRMADSVMVFRDNAIERQRLREEQKQAELRAEQEKKQAMNDLADRFQDSVQGIIQAVASASVQLSQTAQSLNGTIANASQMTDNAVSGAKQAAGNVQAVASAAEEMSATVQEIASQTKRSAGLIDQSVSQVGDADMYAQSLSEAAAKVKEVTKLISDIAGQTNLLALNATIESARAGEAGKGFAVVAGEVKNLASQTDNSIKEIDFVIQEMNAASEDIVKALTSIKTTVAQISDASTSVSGSIEEQNAATQEIAQSMQFASQGTTEISNNLDSINEDAMRSKEASEEVFASAQELSEQAKRLDHEVNDFLSSIRVSD